MPRPTSLSGRINLRRSDQEAAIAALKTAIFWDPKLIDAHILLGRIFWTVATEAGSQEVCTLSAITIDPNNQEAMALQRQVTLRQLESLQTEACPTNSEVVRSAFRLFT